MFILLVLVQLLKLKIVLVAACLLVVEGVEAHVGLLHFSGTIVKRSGGVLLGGYGHCHFGSEHCAVRALRALGPYLEYSAHRL